MYINDLINIPATPNIILYADDTNVFFTDKSLEKLENSANAWLHKLSLWLQLNQIEFNIGKTKYIIFKPRNKEMTSTVTIKFLNSLIEQVPSHKFLGVWFDETLNWTRHVNHVRSKISSSVGILNRVKFLLPSWLMCQLYYSLINSHLNYCLLVWGSTTKTNLDKIITIKKKLYAPLKAYHPKSMQPLIFRSIVYCVLISFSMLNLR